MSIIRAIKESGASIFASVLLDEECNDNNVDENFKDLIQEKEDKLTNSCKTISQLQRQILELEENNNSLKKQLQEKYENIPKLEKKLYASETVLESYEKFIAEITKKYKILKEQKHVTFTHLENLEFAFSDLIEKYERSKEIIRGYQKNQDMLREQIEIYNIEMQKLTKKFNDFKTYAENQIQDANKYIEKNEKTHISELAKIKSKALQDKVKINELQKLLSEISSNSFAEEEETPDNGDTLLLLL